MKSILTLVAIEALVAFGMSACTSPQKQTAASHETKAVIAAPPPAAEPVPAKTTPQKNSKSKTKSPTDEKNLTCVNGSDTRLIAVVAKDNGCELSYTKDGKDTTPASSKYGTKHCKDTQAMIRTKLEAAGFHCN